MSKPHETIEVWTLEGPFQHALYSPRGDIEGVMIDVDGVPAQFVFGKHDDRAVRAVEALRAGQRLIVDGTVAAPPPHGEAAHEVYAFERLASIDGKPFSPDDAPREVKGRVARIHHARHGEPNGVVLDTGDFIHTRPDGYVHLALKPGDAVTASGPARPLRGNAEAHVIEAHTVNGQAVPAKPAPR